MTVAASPRLAPLCVGSLRLSSRVLVAPMVGITDAPFRAVAAEMGAGLTSTEMVAAEAVARRIPAALRLLDFPAGVWPVGAQLVGSDPRVMAEAARIAVDRGAATVDVNLGCPVRKVVSLGSGAGLARDVAATARVLDAVVRAVEVPVTAKMRLGWDASTINAPRLAGALEGAGVRMVTVHGRTRCQGYSGAADWEAIAGVTRAVGIPVIGSGDVTGVEAAARRIEEGRVAGVVVARGLLGNFWLLRQLAHRLATGELLADQPFAERVALARRHLDALCDYWGDARALRTGRKYVSWTVRGCNGASRLRAMVQDIDSRKRLHRILDLALAAGQRPEGVYQPLVTAGDG